MEIQHTPPPPYPPTHFPPPPHFPVPPVAPPQTAAPLDPRARNAAIALFVAAGLTLIGIASRAWFTSHHDSVGLLGISSCDSDSGGCQTMTWLDVRRAPAELKLFAVIGLLGAATAIGFLIHAGVVLLRRNAAKVKRSGTTIALAIAGGGSLLFMMRIGLGSGLRASIGWAGFVCLAGLIGALVIMSKMVRPLVEAAVPAGRPLPLAMGATGAVGSVAAAPGATTDAARAYPLVIQDGLTRYYGHVFLRANRLFFICNREGGGLGVALGTGLGGLLGNKLMEAAAGGVGATPDGTLDDDTLVRAAHDHPGSIVMEAHQITEIKQNIWWRLIRWNGKKFGLPRGLGNELKPAIGTWARYHGVKTTGF